MATLMDNLTFPDIDFPCYSTTTTTTTTTSTDDENCNWKEWSPVVNWNELSGDSDHINTTVDFVDHDFIESMMMDEDNPSDLHIHHPTTPILDDDHSQEAVNGLRLVHLLMAAAEALSGVNKSHELARVILVRLKELVSPNGGTNIERLVAHFTDALQSLLDSSGQQNYKDDNHQNQTDVLAAFQLLQDMSPYVKFGHFTANQAILEAVTNDRRIHIIDYDIMEGIQWASLMQALVSRKNGPNAPHLRITALSRSRGGRRSFGTVQETGRRLAAFAASIGQPFSFHQSKLDSDHETFKPSAIKLVKGEALIINCMLNLPHFISYRAPDSVSSFLSSVKTLNPRLITLVEEETTMTGELGGIEFVGKFMDSLHHYSAIYDSLDSGFPMQDGARELVERVFLGPRIARTVSKIYRERGESRCYSWADRLAAMGFHGCGISFANHCQAKLLLGLFNDGYRVEELGINKLVLGWKSRRLLSVSVWSYPIPDFWE